MGVGGMMGAGLYTLLGLAATSTGTWLPVAFLLAGLVAALSVYSYSKLGAKYPSRGGAAEFLLEEFGQGVISGGLNVSSTSPISSRRRSTPQGSPSTSQSSWEVTSRHGFRRRSAPA